MTLTPDGAFGPPMIGALLRMPADAVLERILDGLHQDGFTDLNAAHVPILRYPGPQNRRPSELASEARMSRQAMNYLLGEMERLGYLTRRDDPDDRRSKRVHLTQRGEAVVRTIRRTVRRIEAECEQELGRSRFAQLRGLLMDLNATSLVRGPRSTSSDEASDRGMNGEGGIRTLDRG